MATILDIEQAASKLRQCLKNGRLPELRLLCGLKFVSLFFTADGKIPDPESYLREFVPPLAADARKCHAREFLPEEIASLGQFVNLLSHHADILRADDITALQSLHTAALSAGPAVAPPGANDRVTCLFVEYYPDLDLSPRGRLLTLSITATPISSKAINDDIVVRNPVAEPDDRFLSQARDSVAAARSLLWRRYKLPQGKRYRFDFAVDSTGARFTGDSLGIAFAVGAIAALSRIEVFRDRLSISSEAAFSGALSADGHVLPIDDEALKLKIYRAFHSDIKYLVIPRNHITTAWDYLTRLEKERSGEKKASTNGKLELMGADSLDSIAADPRFLPRTRSSATAYLARRVWHTKRSAWVEIPALAALALILFILIAPARWMPWFDDNPKYVKITKRGFDVLNARSIFLWSMDYRHELGETAYEIGDVNNDGMNEVAFCPGFLSFDTGNANLFVYSYKGKPIFQRQTFIPNEYPGDSSHVQFFRPLTIDFVHNQRKNFIISAISRSNPARTHLRLWNAIGDSMGWYINAGFTNVKAVKCFQGTRNECYLMGGYNNRMGRAAIFSLNLDSSYGASPPYRDIEYDLTSVKHGNQKFYIVFPMSDIGKSLKLSYNAIRYIFPESSNSVDIKIDDGEDNRAILDYYLDSNFRVVDVIPEDAYNRKAKIMIAAGTLPQTSLPIDCDKLICEVQYWTDSGWVTEGQLRAAENLYKK